MDRSSQGHVSRGEDGNFESGWDTETSTEREITLSSSVVENEAGGASPRIDEAFENLVNDIEMRGAQASHGGEDDAVTTEGKRLELLRFLEQMNDG